MNRRDFVFLTAAASGALAFGEGAAMAQSSHRGLTVVGDKFFLDGKPHQILSGEMHYPRIPREYWRHRIKMAKAMGLNCVTAYIFWNVHEPEPERYDFSGNSDVAAWLRTIQEEGMHVILRPGPYVCAEWEFGGYPAWLLRNPETICRSRDEKFMVPARRWLNRLGKEIADLQYPNGPIVAVQVENEYGSFGNDHEFMAQTRDAIVAAGFNRAPRYTTDGADELPGGALPDVLIAIEEGGPGEFAKREKFRAGGPRMVGEMYPGWLSHWGEPQQVRDGSLNVPNLEWNLAHAASMSFYMLHGGSNFGFMNGANYSKEQPYQPTTQSYDYDAPVAEGGDPRSKYFLFRNILKKHTGKTLPAPPKTPERISIPEFGLSETASFSDLLGSATASDVPQHMEAYGQDYGYILYRTKLAGPINDTLTIDDVRDYAVIMLDGEVAGTLDRRLRQKDVKLASKAASVTLDILVENTGRLNFGREFVYDRKGVRSDVVLGAKILKNWDVFTLPMRDLSRLRFSGKERDSVAFYRGRFHLDSVGDTFLDTRMLGKGVLWVNGHNVGRFWSIGPQYAMYVPASWLKKGENEIVAFDLEDRNIRKLNGRTQALFAPLED